MYKAQYLGTTVAVKVLKDDNAVAIGDFRWASQFVLPCMCLRNCLCAHIEEGDR